MAGKTSVSIQGEDFLINGKLTYAGRTWKGNRVEGLLFNSRMVQSTFDDLNPDTIGRWVYPDTKKWEPERNVNEFIAMLPVYRKHGLLAVTLGLQGGCPEGYCKIQPWINSALTVYGDLRPIYVERFERILAKLDELGMVAIVSIYYFGQDERLLDEESVKRGVDNTVKWLLEGGHTNVILEVANEIDVPRYEHPILHPTRIHELIERAREISHNGRRLLVGTSYKGKSIPGEKVLAASDFAVIHGNSVTDPAFIGEMVTRTRQVSTYRPMPIINNEDDHFEFDKPVNNLIVATQHHSSWGYYDGGPGSGGLPARSDYIEGFQNVPVNWTINTETKKGFFNLVKEITGE